MDRRFGKIVYEKADDDESITVETTPRGLKFEILTRDEDTDGILMGDSFLMEAEDVLDLYSALRSWIGQYASENGEGIPTGELYSQAYRIDPARTMAVWDDFFFTDNSMEWLRDRLTAIIEGVRQ